MVTVEVRLGFRFLFLAVKYSLKSWEEGTPLHTEAEMKEVKEKLPVSAR